MLLLGATSSFIRRPFLYLGFGMVWGRAICKYNNASFVHSLGKRSKIGAELSK